MSKPNKADKSLDNYINKLINNTQEWEPLVLACLDTSEAAMEKASGCLCVHMITQRRILEFEDRRLNALYLAMELYYSSVTSTGGEYQQAPIVVIHSFLSYLCTQPEPCGISVSGIPDAIALLERIRRDVDGPSSMALFELGFRKWLHKIRIITVVSDTGQTPNWTSTEMMEAFNSIDGALPDDSTVQRDFNLDELCITPEGKVERLRTGIVDLDNLLGGGFAKGDSAGALAPSGGGKTVAACQLATGMIYHNGPDTRGALISTEQRARELFPRIVSANLKIPFEGMEDGIILENLDESSAAKVKNLMTFFGSRLKIHEWEKKSGATSFKTDLENLIKRYIREMGRLDFIVFDWLGASLNGKIGDKPDQLRIIYKMAADAMSDLAEKYNLVIIFFGQADTKGTVGKKHVQPSDARECKDLHYNTAVFWGISALKTTDKNRGDHGTDDNKTNETYHKEQFWTFDKIRKGKPRVLTVHRDFGFQRFAFESDNKTRLHI